MNRFVLSLLATLIAATGLVMDVVQEAKAGPREAYAAKHSRRAEVHHRQRRQHDRIQQGVKSGELTPEEAQSLRHEERGIQQMKKDAVANDGHIDGQELKAITEKQNEVSKEIYEEKHDTEKR